MKTLKMVALTALAIALAACCSCRKGVKIAEKPLEGPQWTLVELNGHPVAATDNFFLVFSNKDNRLNGRGDCNSVMGDYKLGKEGILQMDHMGSTRAMCPNQRLEDEFFQTLGRVTKYNIDGEMLLLMNDESELLAVMKVK